MTAYYVYTDFELDLMVPVHVAVILTHTADFLLKLETSTKPNAIALIVLVAKITEKAGHLPDKCKNRARSR